jgi:hypothetical protein
VFGPRPSDGEADPETSSDPELRHPRWPLRCTNRYDRNMPKRIPAAEGTRPDRAAVEQELPLRVTVVRPPQGVRFCLQSGKSDLVSPALSTGQNMSFDFAVRVTDTGGGPPRFLGPFTQGSPDGRFVYVCSGTSAGQHASCWTRRAKVPLTGVTWPLIRQAMKHAGARVEGRFTGTAKDGGPSCATVALLDGGWRVIE